MKRFPFAEFFVVLLAVMSIVSSVAAEQGKGQTKVTICHKGKNTLTVAEPAVAAHLAHGDAMGPCQASPSK
jgi:hypothetical protein